MGVPNRFSNGPGNVPDADLLMADFDYLTGSPGATAYYTADGSAGSPAFSFTNDPDSGMYRLGTNNISLGTNGTTALQINPSQQCVFTDGSVSFPSISFINDIDSGMYRIGTNNIALGTNGTKALEITGTQAVILTGTSTNDSAGSGKVGEVVRSGITTFTNFPTTGQYGDLTSISLTAGDWDVSVNFEAITGGATVTDIRCGIGTVSGNSSTGLNEGDNVAYGPPPTSVITQSLSIPPFRVSLSGTTTYYLKYRAGFSGGPPQAVGRISARRAR